jgi:Putative glycosyl/glycerophosphate transferases involved in teichoic acid biosynthesis TagF/TagB/EpsJ/RodC
MKIDFYASQSNSVDHMAPVWNALPESHRGNFYITPNLIQHAESKIEKWDLLYSIFNKVLPSSPYPLLTASYGDMLHAWKQNPGRSLIRMEHGVGVTFGTAGYADGRGRRDKASLYLFPNEYLAAKHAANYDIPYQVIGTPKLDWLHWSGTRALDKTVCIGFHWGDRNTNPPESGSAFEYYKDIIPQLAGRFKIIGHGHPMAEIRLRKFFEGFGVEYVPDFNEVIKRAALLVHDISSVLYEFITTGKPVILLNAPWFRKEKHYGIRFWEYTDIGPMIDDRGQLGDAISLTLADPSPYEAARQRAKADLYPHFGYSAWRAVNSILEFLHEKTTA